MRRRRALPAAVLWGIGMAAAADTAGQAEKPEDEGLVEEVEVEADLPEAEDVAAFFTTLEGGELTRRGADLAGLLRRVPGARVRDYGGFGRYATVSLRGSTAEQVTVLVDGIPQNRALGGPVDLSFIPATHLDRVTVFRGFGPAGAGMGGVGGLVDIRTRAPGPEPEGQVDLLGGDLGTARVSTGWSLRAGARGAIRVGAEWIDSRGDFRYLDTKATAFDPSDDEIRARENNELEQGALLFQGTWEGVAGGRLRLGGRIQRRDRGVPGLDAFPSENARLEEGLRDARLTWAWRGDGRLQGVDLLADGFGQSFHLRDVDGELGVGAQDETTRLSGGGLAGLFRAALPGHRLLARLDLRREEASVRDRLLVVSDRGGAQRDLVAVILEDVIPLGRWILAPALRWELRRDDFVEAGAGTLPPPAADLREDLWSGKLGAAVRLGGGCSIRGSAGTFFRSPNLLELFGDRGSVVGSPGLRPEEGRSAELGAACSHERARHPWRWELVAFGRDADDLILFVPNSQGTAVARNIQAARIRGAEAALAFRWRDWTLDAAGTLQRTRDTSGGFADGKPLVGIPEQEGYLGLGWGRKGLGLRWDVTYVGENSTDSLDDPDLRLPARVLHDVNVTYEWSYGLTAGLDVRNLFDRQTRDVARFPLPGRVVFLHVGWRTGPS